MIRLLQDVPAITVERESKGELRAVMIEAAVKLEVAAEYMERRFGPAPIVESCKETAARVRVYWEGK